MEIPDTWPDGIRVLSRAKARRDGRGLAPTHLLTLLDDGMAPAEVGLDPAARLHLVMTDTHDRRAACAPDPETIARMLAFGRAIPPSGRLLIHCLSGQSRSPAAALGILAQRMPPRDAAASLTRICPDATPNRLIVTLCDDALGLGGKLVAAVADLPKPRWQG